VKVCKSFTPAVGRFCVRSRGKQTCSCWCGGQPRPALTQQGVGV